MPTPDSICHICKHYHRKQQQIETCDAFPQSIPALFIEDGQDHFKPFPEDNGIQFELASDADKPAIQAAIKQRKKSSV